MTVEIIDGIRVLKLRDAARGQGGMIAAEDAALFHIWRLLSGGAALRDNAVGPRRIL
jgi:hypothetical protein